MSRRTGWTLFGFLLLALILIPFFAFESSIREWSQALVGSMRPTWIAGPAVSLLLAADVVLPVPSSVISTAAGMLLGLWPGALASWIGMMAGCACGYCLGAGAGRGLARSLVGPRELERVGRASERFGDWMIVLFRAVPVLAEASVVFAGTIGIRIRRFFALSALSNAGIAVVYAAVGAYSASVASFLWALAGAVMVPLIALMAVRVVEKLAR